MRKIIEKRQAKRVCISCELSFRPLNADKYYEAFCIDLSCSGISFCSEHRFEIDEKVEVKIIPEPPVMFTSTFVVKIVRVECQENDFFSVGATIEYEDSVSNINDY